MLTNKIGPLLLALATSLAAAIAQAPIAAERVEAIVQLAGERFAPKGVAVAVVQDGQVLIETAFGECRDGVPMTPTSLCNIASCSKAFTAAAIAMLVEQGQLGWDDPVVEHLPEFRLADPWITARMTIRDLLCHRSGLVTFAGDLLWYGSDHDDVEVLRRLAKLPIEQRFRDQFGYQNLMYLAAGLIIERKTGQPWTEFVQQRLLTPLGMLQSRPDAQSLPDDAERALPHIDGEAIPDHEFVACKPAASIYSSVHDLTAWMRMLMADGKWDEQQLLATTSLNMMWRPHTSLSQAGSGPSTGDFYSYGLGWFLSIEQGNKVVEHDGGMPGFLSKVSLMPARNFGFVVLNNANDGVLNEAIKRALLAEMAGQDGLAQIERLARVKQRIDQRNRSAVAAREAQRRLGTSPSRDLADFAGNYVDDIYGPAEVALRDGKLHFVMLPSKRRLFGDMVHWHDNTFRIDFPDRFLPFALVSFEFDSGGAVVGFRIDCPIADFDFGALRFRRQS